VGLLNKKILSIRIITPPLLILIINKDKKAHEKYKIKKIVKLKLMRKKFKYIIKLKN
jgi:hypothetical protein